MNSGCGASSCRSSASRRSWSEPRIRRLDEIPADISKVGIAFQVYGPGSIWFDDLLVAWVHD